MAHRWDPDRYLAFADERGRPFVELVSRIGAHEPGLVVDLGCGAGNLTRLLADRWPSARVVGIDSSEEMVGRARAVEGITARVGDLRAWARADSSAPASTVDVLVTNAALQWVPDHLELVPALVERVAPGGWFAMQVPANLDQPSHTIRRDLAAEPRYASYTQGVAAPHAHATATYLRVLQECGCEVDAWETTYLHVLRGRDPVFTWVSGTGARPTLQALPEELRPPFEAELRRRLRAAYPDEGNGVVLPFRRVFAVARRR